MKEESLLWRDGKKNIAHVIGEAGKLFPSVCVTTNGTLPFRELDLDRVWVSLDGTEKVHDSVRGEGVFSKVWGNLEKEGRRKAYISFTISQLNRECVSDLITMLKGPRRE